MKGTREIVCPIDPVGKFVDPVTDFKGQYVKDADKNIIKKLKEDGRLVNLSHIRHSYPFCWRSETPLLYRHIDPKSIISFGISHYLFRLFLTLLSMSKLRL